VDPGAAGGGLAGEPVFETVDFGVHIASWHKICREAITKKSEKSTDIAEYLKYYFSMLKHGHDIIFYSERSIHTEILKTNVTIVNIPKPKDRIAETYSIAFWKPPKFSHETL
jgi:hypothetical protein